MAVTYVGEAETGGATATYPAGISVGDFYVATYQNPSACTLSVSAKPVSATAAGPLTSPGADWNHNTRMVCVYGLYEAGQTVTFAGACNGQRLATMAFTGVDQTTPFIGGNAVTRGLSAAQHSHATGLTTTKDGSLVLAVMTSNTDADLNPPSNPALGACVDNNTCQIVGDEVGTDGGMYGMYGTMATAGAVGTATWNIAYGEMAGFFLALNPADPDVVPGGMNMMFGNLATRQTGR